MGDATSDRSPHADGRDVKLSQVVEALVECLDWIRQSDIYDDQRDSSTRWIVDGVVRAQPPMPGDYYANAAELQAAIDDVYDLVSRAEGMLQGAEIEWARVRYRLRRRYQG